MSPCYTFASSYFGDKAAHSVLKDENEEESHLLVDGADNADSI
mgnify:CR=1 FL=1